MLNRLTILCGFLFVATLIASTPAWAGELDFLDGIAIGAGMNQGTDNDADETWALSAKMREGHWEYGVDICRSEGFGGVAVDRFGFVWASWIEDFQRPEWQDYGIYVGGGAGVFVLQDELVDWPAGPFATIGWDFSPQAGLEGKVGYFGENYWGTALLYWYFE